jgi:homoserine O-acetyltransferase/O-succinyltransferase
MQETPMSAEFPVRARFWRAACSLLLFAAPFVASFQAQAANFPEPRQGDWVARDFRFHDGTVMPQVRLHYRTIGEPSGEPVLVLHGTAGSGASMLGKTFGDELFGPGQPLDASRYFIILPDALGTGQSTRPSDGLRAKFPNYNYDDMVRAQHRLVTEGLGIKHLRLVIGNSMGGMQAWMWASQYPKMMDAVVPMACLPVAMSGRNWMMRRMLTQAIRHDPDWKGGDYTVQPPRMQTHLTYFALATAGGNQALFSQAPTSAKADALIDKRLSAPFKGDANDVLYQWESSADFDPSAGLDAIEASVLAINSSDDERNPPELGVMEREIKRVRNGRYLLVPGGPDTAGHGSTMLARLYKKDLADLLSSAPRR